MDPVKEYIPDIVRDQETALSIQGERLLVSSFENLKSAQAALRRLDKHWANWACSAAPLCRSSTRRCGIRLATPFCRGRRQNGFIQSTARQKPDLSVSGLQNPTGQERLLDQVGNDVHL